MVSGGRKGKLECEKGRGEENETGGENYVIVMEKLFEEGHNVT